MEILTYKAGSKTDVIDKVMNTLYWKVPEVPLTRGQMEAFEENAENYLSACRQNKWTPVELSIGEYIPSCGGELIEHEHMLLINQNGAEISVYAPHEIDLEMYSNTIVGNGEYGLIETDPNLHVQKGNCIPSKSESKNMWGEVEEIPNLIWENGAWN